jgi:hypothetical protein
LLLLGLAPSQDLRLGLRHGAFSYPPGMLGEFERQGVIPSFQMRLCFTELIRSRRSHDHDAKTASPATRVPHSSGSGA